MKCTRVLLTVVASVGMVRTGFAITWSGYSTMLPGTTVAERPELAGDVVASQDIHVQSGSVAFLPDVILHNYVVQESGAGTLDFYFQLTNDTDTTENILQMTVSGFNIGPATDVDQINPGTGYWPFFASHLAPDTLAFGSAARGSGTFPLNPGESSAALFIRTDAVTFADTGVFWFEGGQVPEPIFTPALGGGALPEPMSLASLPLALVGLGLKRRMGRS